MNVGAVSAVGNGTAPVYAALSPYLNGVVRTSDAAAAAQLQATVASASAAATAAAIAARAAADATITAAPPFANPAITAIGQRTALGESLRPPPAVTPNALLGEATPPSPTNSVLFGDGGTLVQSYGAVALVAGWQALPPVYTQPTAPAIPPAASVSQASGLLH